MREAIKKYVLQIEFMENLCGIIAEQLAWG
jgi:hypothetical protein